MPLLSIDCHSERSFSSTCRALPEQTASRATQLLRVSHELDLLPTGRRLHWPTQCFGRARVVSSSNRVICPRFYRDRLPPGPRACRQANRNLPDARPAQWILPRTILSPRLRSGERHFIKAVFANHHETVFDAETRQAPPIGSAARGRRRQQAGTRREPGWPAGQAVKDGTHCQALA